VFEPASGSVIANTILPSPEAIGGSQRSCCSGVPNRASRVPQIAGDTISSSSGQPWAASSSVTMASSLMPMPPPPCSAGRLTPTKPAPLTACQSSVVFSPALALARK
jgi:hypothetical protein